jgi:hypothetical protein
VQRRPVQCCLLLAGILLQNRSLESAVACAWPSHLPGPGVWLAWHVLSEHLMAGHRMPTRFIAVVGAGQWPARRAQPLKGIWGLFSVQRGKQLVKAIAATHRAAGLPSRVSGHSDAFGMDQILGHTVFLMCLSWHTHGDPLAEMVITGSLLHHSQVLHCT